MSDLANIAPCGIVLYLDDGSIQEVNTGFCEITGFSEQELLSMNIENLFPIATRIFYQTHFAPLLRMQGHVEEIFITITSKSKQSLPLLLNANRFNKEGVWKNVCSFIVVKNRRKYEDEILEAKKVAEKALNENTELTAVKQALQENVELLDKRLTNLQQRNEEWRQFGHAISHDLQEPLRKLSVFADMLQRQMPTGSDAEYALRKIFELYKRMRTMVLGLQQFIWLEQVENKLEKINLNGVVADVHSKILEETGGKDFDLDVEPLPEIEADKAQMELLFYHLFQNAVNFKKPTEQLRIQITAALVQQNQFSLIKDKYKYTDHVKINFSDNGIGFNQSQSENIFRLFRKISVDSQGMGLGLSFCKKVVDNHYGSINVVSNPNEGATFTILLPIKQD